jgi:hypothetical protein
MTDNWHLERPNATHSALNHILLDRAAFNKKWQQSKFHCDTSPAIRALIASIHDQMGRLEDVLKKEAKADKDEDKRAALLASIIADPDANTDLD